MKFAIFATLFFLFPFTAQAYFTTFDTISGNMISILDWTPPQTTMVIQSSIGEQKHVTEFMMNGSFTDGIVGWETSGHVFFPENGVVQLGSLDDATDTIHAIQQTIPSSAQSLTFSYRIGTQEVPEGFDDPAFLVTMNNTQVFSASWKDASEDWKIAYLNLPSFSDPVTMIQFSVQNTGDTLNPTWVQLKNITTDVGLANSTQKLSFIVSDTHPAQTYVQQSLNVSPQLYLNPFSLTQPLEEDRLNFWSIDQEKNTEEKQEKSIVFRGMVLPPLVVLSVVPQPRDEVVITLADTHYLGGNHAAYTLLISNQNIYPYAVDHSTNSTTRLFFRLLPNSSPSSTTLEYRDPFGNTSQKENILL